MPKNIRKVWDVTVKTGEYTNPEGEKKNKWQVVGSVLVGEDGNHFISLARWFNPAGVPQWHNNGNPDVVYLGCYDPKPRDEAPPARKPVGEVTKKLMQRVSDMNLKGRNATDHASRAANDDSDEAPF